MMTNNDKGPTSDKANTDGKLMVTQDIAGIVLSTLRQAAELAPVPYLKEATGLAVALFDMVQGTLENESAFNGLASDACELVYTATSVWRDHEEDNDGKPLPQDLMDHFKELLKMMTNVMQFAKARASRGLFERIISNKADAGQIEWYRAQIKDALDQFGMQAHITVRDAVSRIQEQQASILAALEAHAPSKSQLSVSTEASSNPSSNPSPPPTSQDRNRNSCLWAHQEDLAIISAREISFLDSTNSVSAGNPVSVHHTVTINYINNTGDAFFAPISDGNVGGRNNVNTFTMAPPPKSYSPMEHSRAQGLLLALARRRAQSRPKKAEQSTRGVSRSIKARTRQARRY